MHSYFYGGASDIGYQRDINEDYVNIVELDEHTLLAVVSDGAGSKCSALQPASIAANIVIETIRRIYSDEKSLLETYPELLLREALHMANRTLGAFRMGNEELYAGFGAGMTCCIFFKDGNFSFAHTGNARLYLIRKNSKNGYPSLRQLTKDQTKAQRLLDEGMITPEHYHTHPDRLIITGGLGFVSEPAIQSFSGALKRQDIVLLTTDGIHYSIIPEAVMQLVIASENCDNAVSTLIAAAKMQKYPDNMSAAVIWNRS